jgi:site-specific recombinase XerD
LTAGRLTATTVSSYANQAKALMRWLDGRTFTKKTAEAYMSYYAETHRAYTVNIMVNAINAYAKFLGRKAALERIEAEVSPPSEPLTQEEYNRLLFAAQQQDDERTSLILQCIYLLSVRVSELHYITADAVREGTVTIHSARRSRTVTIPNELRSSLLDYANRQGILSRSIFLTSRGKPIHRKLVWQNIKKLCLAANIPEEKGFPDNLRFTLATEVYEQFKDIPGLQRLAERSRA